MTSQVPVVTGVELQPPPGITQDSLVQAFGSIGNAISRAFEMMSIAEEVISEFIRRNPEHREQINQSFSILRWSSENTINDDLYRSHVSELLERVVNGQELGMPTTAEKVMVIHYTSLKAPLSVQFTVLYEELFRQALPKYDLTLDYVRHQEQWDGATREAENEVVRKLLPLTQWRNDPVNI